jgi:hypothetical protein
MNEPVKWLLVLGAIGVLVWLLGSKRGQIILVVVGWVGVFASGLAAIFETGYAMYIFWVACAALILAGINAMMHSKRKANG